MLHSARHRPAPSIGTLSLLGLALWAFGDRATAQDWPHWRGPHYDGSTTASDLPLEFDQERGVRWRAALPGPAASTPIVVGDRIYLTSVDDEREVLVALCLDRTNGKVRWSRDAGSGYGADGGSRVRGGRRSNYASPSPTTDGERVVFFFGNGDLVAYDVEGEPLWQRNIQADYGDFAFQWTFSASPTLWEDKVFLPVLQRDQPVGGGRRRGGGRRQHGGPAQDPVDASDGASRSFESFVLGIDPRTGETTFRHVRPSPARMESLESYATMIPHVTPEGRKELVLAGGDVLTGHDPANGDELWRWGTWNPAHRQRAWRLVPSAVLGAGMALVCAPKRAPAFAVQLGGTGDLGDDALAWQSEGRPNPVSSDVPTPAFADGHFYVLSDVHHALSKVTAGDGTVAWTTELSGDALWRASPTVADGKVWCINHHGEVVVVAAADGSILHQAAMAGPDDDQIRSSIVIAHGDVYIRTNDALFCIGG
ncbi:MAG: PQQ-binding-like beta-propeller repeat protein [Planctomycetota bacterium]